MPTEYRITSYRGTFTESSCADSAEAVKRLLLADVTDVRVEVVERLDDADALNEIAAHLRLKIADADILDEVQKLVEATGREVS